MILEFITFWIAYWIVAYGPLVGGILITGSFLMGIGLFTKLLF